MVATARPELSGTEIRVVVALAAIYMTRMLGLFLLLPVLAIYASGLLGGTPALVGLAMGAYGLTNALLQIPFGRWSDRYGRRPVIFAGLGIFCLGSVVGAFAHSLPMLILARAIQGAGAMSAAVSALVADHTRDEVRTRAMAVIGISIGSSFIISLVLGPVLEAAMGVAGIFWLMAALAIAGMGLLSLAVPEAAACERVATQHRASLWTISALPALRPYFAGVFALHFVLTATFLSIPLVLLHDLGMSEPTHWKVYLGVFLFSLTGTVPLILGVERSSKPNAVFVGAILIAAAAQAVLAIDHGAQVAVLAAFTVFFAAFNFLEARLPAQLSKAVPQTDRGGALGVFATCQFLGSAFGGALGGQLQQHWGVSGVFWGSAVVALAWATIAAQARGPAVARG
jgi:MFS family permease